MRYIINTLKVLAFVVVGLFLHYSLPQHDVARVTGISDRIETLSWFQRFFYAQVDAGADEGAIRDLRLINTEKQRAWLLGFLPREGTQVMVYRNEDTGWRPPFFKFDSSNLEAEAQALVGQQDQWVVITHYGWRNEFFSIYPNAVSLQRVDSPDHYPIPWFNIFFFVFALFALRMMALMWAQFRERSVDPLLDQAGDGLDVVQARVARRRSGLRRWLDTWKRKEPPR